MRKKAQIHSSALRPCEVAGCVFAGEYKAPKSRYNTEEYQYLCLEHVREFNQAWDYFAGWNREQIENFMDGSHYGHRPTWDMTARINTKMAFFTSDSFKNSFFEMLGEKAPVIAPALPRAQRDALAIFNLPANTDLHTIKTHYKKLVKQYHPDVNKDNKLAEETFKKITTAYKILKEIYTNAPKT